MRSLRKLDRQVRAITKEMAKAEKDRNYNGVFTNERAFLDEWTWAIHGIEIDGKRGWDSKYWPGWLCPICMRDVEEVAWPKEFDEPDELGEIHDASGAATRAVLSLWPGRLR